MEEAVRRLKQWRRREARSLASRGLAARRRAQAELRLRKAVERVERAICASRLAARSRDAAPMRAAGKLSGRPGHLLKDQARWLAIAPRCTAAEVALPRVAIARIAT
jgi:hypothetical protein